MILTHWEKTLIPHRSCKVFLSVGKKILIPRRSCKVSPFYKRSLLSFFSTTFHAYLQAFKTGLIYSFLGLGVEGEVSTWDTTEPDFSGF